MANPKTKAGRETLPLMRRTSVPVDLHVIGRRDLLPPGLAETVEQSGSLSKPDGSIRVTIAIAYSGRDDPDGSPGLAHPLDVVLEHSLGG
jgi:undecaprenyl pyrophosphate synthase